MYCHKCGKPIKPHYTGICPACSFKEISFAEYMENTKHMREKQKKEDRNTLIAVIIAGLFCPLIWIIYFFYKNRNSVGKWATSSGGSYSSGSGSYSEAGSSSSTSSFDAGSSEEGFLITGGDGVTYESGGLFCDWAGDYVEWGSSFRDSRGNLVSWGSPFYDKRGNYITWGSPFYDAGDNYVNPRG